MHRLNITARLLAASLLLICGYAHAQSELVYTTFPGPGQGGWCIGQGDTWAGVAVQTPAGAPLGIEQVELRLSDETTDGPGSPFSLNLYLDDDGTPGDFVSTIGNGTGEGGGPGSSFEIYTITPEVPVPVDAETVYWILAETDVTGFSCAFGWSYNGTEPSGTFEYVGERNRFGASETDRTGTYMQLQITAGPLAGDAPDERPSAIAVPFLSLWGLLFLTSLMAIGGILVLRRP